MTEKPEQPQVNNGIWMGGSARISDSAMAAGDGATAHYSADSPLPVEALRAVITELRQRLDAWERTSEAGRIEPGRLEQAQDEAEAVLSELADDRPVDEGRLMRRLTRLRSHVAGVASLLGLVASAEQSLRAIAGR